MPVPGSQSKGKRVKNQWCTQRKWGYKRKIKCGEIMVLLQHMCAKEQI